MTPSMFIFQIFKRYQSRFDKTKTWDAFRLRKQSVQTSREQVIAKSNNPEITMQALIDSNYNAFQGTVLFEEGGNGCFLEYATEDPYKFKDESQIIYLESEGIKSPENNSKLCSGRFEAPYGYKFKFVVLAPWQLESANLSIQHGTDKIMQIK